ncbi:MAG: hypothetical protein AMJ78_06590 [Omnitrophica WOR_2 bacterium SM23_29]|nr:MAG: hypothetical protein AMJ78_06590 [Omnitrophica WOR_2 bacterium SM23_29]
MRFVFNNIRKVSIIFLIPILIAIIHARVFAKAPHEVSRVYVEKNRLFIERRLQDGSKEKKPYIIYGVSWGAATRAPDSGPNPKNPKEETDYGFFFDWPERDPQGHIIFIFWIRNQFKEHYLTDIPLLREMNVNTVRVFNDFGDDPDAYAKILDEFHRNGIMVIMTVASSKADLESERYLKVIRYCKDHPAILMWSLGNEWNLEWNRYYGYETVLECARATNEAAKKIKKVDRNHPVSSSLGDRFYDEDPNNTIAKILKVCPDVDIWGLNIYRGSTFAGLFEQWQDLTSKPMYISEFGTDSFHTTKYTDIEEFQADDCEGYQDENVQADFIIKLWTELTGYLSALNPTKPCVGGLVHEFNDELWKVGCYHATLGGLVDYYSSDEVQSYKEYNTEGFILASHPDGVANEEHFGVVTADRKPKKAFYELKRYYGILKEKEELIGKPQLF